MHNLLITLSALMLAGAGILGYLNQEKLSEERGMKESVENSLDEVAEELENQREVLQQATEEAEAAKTAREAFEKETQALVEQVSAREDELLDLQSELTDKKDQLSTLQQQMAEAGDLSEQAQTLTELKQNVAAMEQQVAQLQAEYESVQSVKAGLDEQIAAFVQREEDRDQKRAPQEFSSQIIRVDAQWGFVVIGAGNSQGLVEGATLNVERGGEKIGQIKITNLFQNRAVADIVRNSVAEGVRIESGDRVVAPPDSELAERILPQS